MEKNVLYGGIDVDDQRFHVCLLGVNTGEHYEFSVRPRVSALVQVLKKYESKGYGVQVCYEAGYLGFSLYRALVAKGIACTVIAPSLIPRKPGARVKTDRLDARKLAHFYQKGLLTPVEVPGVEEERLRSLFRSKDFLGRSRQRLRDHVVGLCRIQGLNYRLDTHNDRGSYWTKEHLRWLGAQASRFSSTPLGLNLSYLLLSIGHLDDQLKLYHEEVLKWAKDPKYRQAVGALVAYRGIREEFAMRLLMELGDIRRFVHPQKIVSYVGLDIVEYSSGGKEKKYGITHHGNGILRWILIEIAQTGKYRPQVSEKLRQRRKGQDPQVVAIADRAMRRIYRKAKHLEHRGKHTNLIKVACARELIGFIWESLCWVRNQQEVKQAA